MLLLMRWRNDLQPALTTALLLTASTVAGEPVAVSRGDAIAATCVTCHHPANEHIPPLANTSAALLATRGETGTTVMHRLVAGLSEEDIQAVAEALARSHGEAR